MSMIAACGRVRRASPIAARRLAAAPTIAIRVSGAKAAARPSRTTSWSSTIRSRIASGGVDGATSPTTTVWSSGIGSPGRRLGASGDCGRHEPLDAGQHLDGLGDHPGYELRDMDEVLDARRHL